MAYFQRLNAIWAEAALPALVVNMYETSLVRHPTGRKGTVFKVKHGGQQSMQRSQTVAVTYRS